jgi:hypothetical protein
VFEPETWIEYLEHNTKMAVERLAVCVIAGTAMGFATVWYLLWPSADESVLDEMYDEISKELKDRKISGKKGKAQSREREKSELTEKPQGQKKETKKTK